MNRDYQKKRLAAAFAVSETGGKIYLAKQGAVVGCFKSINAAFFWAFPRETWIETYRANFAPEGDTESAAAYILEKPLQGTSYKVIYKTASGLALEYAREKGAAVVVDIWDRDSRIIHKFICLPNGKTRRLIHNYKPRPRWIKRQNETRNKSQIL